MKSLTRTVDEEPKLAQRQGVRTAQSLEGINLVTNSGVYPPRFAKGGPPAEERGGFGRREARLEICGGKAGLQSCQSYGRDTHDNPL
jgi:hypothetical protein